METIYQGDEEGCGIACLRMLLSLLSKERNYRYLTLDGHPPYSLEALQKGAAKEGLNLLFKRVTSKEELYANTAWPVLLLLGKENDSHCVLALKERGKRILIADPSSGKRWRKIEDVFSDWNGIYGEVLSYSPVKCPYHKKELKMPAVFIFSSIAEIFSEAALYAGFYNVEKNGDYLLSVVAFALFGLFAIGKRYFAVSAMKRFDQENLDKIYDPEPKRLKENYQHYYHLKSLYFGGWIEFVSALFFSSALLLLVGFNSPYFLVSAAGYLAFALFEGFYWQSHLEGEKADLERAEKTLFSGEMKPEEKKESINELSQKAYQLGDFVSYSGAIRLVLSLALALIPVLAEQKISLNYFLFHFFALLAIGEGFEKIVSFFLHSRERSQEFDYFLEYFLKEEK
jgi:hypothetical protein